MSHAFTVCDTVSVAVTLESRKLFAICLYFLWKRLVTGQFKNSRYLLYQSEIKRNSQTTTSRVSPAPATGNWLTFDWFGPLMKTTSTRYCWVKIYRIKWIVKKLKSIDWSRSSKHNTAYYFVREVFVLTLTLKFPISIIPIVCTMTLAPEALGLPFHTLIVTVTFPCHSWKTRIKKYI